jgi:transposase-like protein
MDEEPDPPVRVETLYNGSTRVSYDNAVASNTVPAPRCPHGHFLRFARGLDEKGRPNCPPCAREPEVEVEDEEPKEP